MFVSFYRSLPLQFMKKKRYFIAEMFGKITSCETVSEQL